MEKFQVNFKLESEDHSEYYPNIGRGNVTKYYVAELPHGWIVKSVFERIENEDNVVLHNESMAFIPKDKPFIYTKQYHSGIGGPN